MEVNALNIISHIRLLNQMNRITRNDLTQKMKFWIFDRNISGMKSCKGGELPEYVYFFTRCLDDRISESSWPWIPR